jgi:hypothetical protein
MFLSKSLFFGCSYFDFWHTLDFWQTKIFDSAPNCGVVPPVERIPCISEELPDEGHRGSEPVKLSIALPSSGKSAGCQVAQAHNA